MFIHVFAEPLQVVTLFFTESLLHHPGKVSLRGLMLQLPLPGLELVAGVRTQTGEIRQQIPGALHPRQLFIQLPDPGFQRCLLQLARQTGEALLEAEPAGLQSLYHPQPLQIVIVVVAIAVGAPRARNHPQLLVIEQGGAGQAAAPGQFGYFHDNHSLRGP